MKRISLLIIILACGLGSMSYAQTTNGVVRGKVKNAVTNEVFSNVNVAVYSLPDTLLVTGTASAEDGSFRIDKLAWGQYIMVAKFVGFSPAVKSFSLSSNSTEYDAGEIVMEESAQELEGVEIVTAKPEVMYKDGKKILNVDQFKNSGASNLVEVLENAPSVTTDTEGNVLLRGSSNYVLLIDGKPAPVTGTNLLKQIPQDMVENIEIITNPSAKYEAEGDAGIINLILKKQTKAGFNSMLTLMAGWNNKYNGSLNFNYRKNKINVYGGVSGTSYYTDVAGDLNRTSIIGGKDYEYNTYLEQITSVTNFSGNFGLDFDPNEKNTFTIGSNFGPLNFDIDLNNKVFRGFTEDGVDEQSQATNGLLLKGFFVNPKVGWLHKFDQDGHQIDFNIFAGGFNGELLQDRNEFLTDDNWNNTQDAWLKNQSKEMSKIRDIRFKLDYEKPFGENRLELGSQVSSYNEDNDFVLENWDFDMKKWKKSLEYSNDAILKRNLD